MRFEIVVGILALGGVGLTTLGGVFGAWLTRKSSKETTKANAKAAEDNAQDKLIDQLQQELERYRARTDQRLDELEVLVRGYRGFIGVQRDHMADHGIPLPPWPDGLPR